MIIVVLMVIYPVDCVIYLLNNLGQLYSGNRDRPNSRKVPRCIDPLTSDNRSLLQITQSA